MLAHSYVVSPGIGDALRVACYAKQDQAIIDAPVVIYVEELPAGIRYAHRALENLAFVNQVYVGPRGYWANLPTPMFQEGRFERAPKYQLLLDVADLKYTPSFHAGLLPAHYTLVQPSTTRFKRNRHLSAAFEPADEPVLVGSLEDRLQYPEAADRWPGCLDLRGQLSVEETMWLCAHAEDAFGVESWVPMLTAMFGRPCRMEVSDEFVRRHGALFTYALPTLAYYPAPLEWRLTLPDQAVAPLSASEPPRNRFLTRR